MAGNSTPPLMLFHHPFEREEHLSINRYTPISVSSLERPNTKKKSK
jgi:hypothetical protein